jgi:hypothetical protein
MIPSFPTEAHKMSYKTKKNNLETGLANFKLEGRQTSSLS